MTPSMSYWAMVSHPESLWAMFESQPPCYAYMVTHTGEKLHICAHCNKSFGLAGNLKTHLLIHEGVKLHKCAQCDKSFSQVGDLKRHLTMHTGKKLHKCTQCDKSFSEARLLKTHQLAHLVMHMFWEITLWLTLERNRTNVITATKHTVELGIWKIIC